MSDTPAVPVSLPVALEEWERLARAATPGPWKQTHDIQRGVKLWGADSSPLFLSIGGLAHSRITPEDPIPQWQKDCDFVRACSPERILGLIAEARRHEEIFRWLLGEEGEFPESLPGRRYNFRTELRARLHQVNSAAPEERDDA